MRRRSKFTQPIPLDQMPTTCDSLANVVIWHLRRVIRESEDWDQVVDVTGISRRTVWRMRRDFLIHEEPGMRKHPCPPPREITGRVSMRVLDQYYARCSKCSYA